MKKTNEPEILKLLANGSEHAFAQVFDLYHSKVFGLAHSFLKSREFAKEVVQEVFLQVWNRKNTFANVKNLEAYIVGMAKHQTLKFLRKRSIEVAAHYQFAMNREVAENNIEDLITEQHYEKHLKQVVDKLPPQQKQIFQLSRMDGLSHQDIADKLHISDRTVNNHINSALKFIRENLELKASSVLLPAFLVIFDK
ncbi:MAG: RNA polymerase sigma-70 factor [Cyclobacteriaceae bacterium]